MLRYVLITTALVLGGTAVAMYFHEKNRPVVIREAQMALPEEFVPPPERLVAPEPKREPAQTTEQAIKNIDSLAGRIDGMLKAGPKFKGR